MIITFKPNEVIVLCGPSSSGKSFFGHRSFADSEMLSSDDFRKIAADYDDSNPVSQAEYRILSEDAFHLLKETLRKRTKNNRLTVIDATNLHVEDLSHYVEIAKENHVPISMLLFDIPYAELMNNDRARKHPRGVKSIKNHIKRFNQIKKDKKGLERMGFRRKYEIHSLDDLQVVIEPNTLHIPIENGLDILGDGHGLLKSRVELLNKAGYVENELGLFIHPEGRKPLYLNDETSRGSLPLAGIEYGEFPSIAMMWMMKKHVEANLAYAVDSNHNYKVWRWLEGRDVTMNHGDELVVSEFEAFQTKHGVEKTEEIKTSLASFLKDLPSHLLLCKDEKVKAVAVHAGIQDDMIGKEDAVVRDFCRFGKTSGEFDANGRPLRLDWTKDHRNGMLIVWGHEPQKNVRKENDTINVDTGGFYGNKLTLLQYPELTIIDVSVPHSFVSDTENPFLQADPDRFAVPRYQDYANGFNVETQWGKWFVPIDRAQLALEMTSTRLAPLEELFYVCPTMAPTPQVSAFTDYLEHPLEALTYYRSKGVKQVVVEQKHMGSRAVVAVCKNVEAGVHYFGKPTLGTVLSRNNYKFFNPENELKVLSKLSLDMQSYFASHDTDFVILDCEIMPWNLKANGLITKQYGLTSNAANYKRTMQLQWLEEFEKNRHTLVTDEIALAKIKLSQAATFHEAFTKYCWDVDADSIDNIQIAPFHILAFGDRTLFDQTNEWNMEQAKLLSTLSTLLVATTYKVVNLDNKDEIDEMIAWWIRLTEDGHEGLVIKPMDFVSKDLQGQLIQPAIKVRGRKYLHIIYGMDYLEPQNLEILKKRTANKKMFTAIREFTLSMESVNRFIQKEPMARVHECVLAAIASTSEPMDPRL
jgi:polynucleotide kinase-phosphatase